VHGRQLFRGEKAVEEPVQSQKVLKESSRTEEKSERIFQSPRRMKALKGEAQECWKLKKASKD